MKTGVVWAFVSGLLIGVGGACLPLPGCEGCISPSGVCLRGLEDSACGSFGQSCVACEATHTCREGACVALTDPGVVDAGTPAEDAGTVPQQGFQLVPSPTTANLRGVAAASPEKAYAVGTGGTVLRWDGSAWSVDDSPTSSNLLAVTLADGAGWAVGESGTLLSLQGDTWSVDSPSPLSGPLTGVSAASAQHALAVGKEGDQLYTLVWDGAQWTKLATGAPQAHTELSDVSMPSDTTAFAAQSGMMMRWTGTTWEQLTTPTTTALQGIWAPSDAEAFAVGSSGLLMRWTASTGRTMEQLPPYTFFQAVWGSSASDVWAVGHGGTIMHWDGQEWSQVPSPTTQDLYGVSGSGPGDVWIVGAGGTLLHGP